MNGRKLAGALAFSVAGAAIAAGGVYRWQRQPPPPPQPQVIAVVDTEKLIRAQVAKALATGQGDPQAFASRLQQQMALLAGQGLVVMPASVAVAYPAGVDHTAQLAQALQLDLAAGATP